MNLSKRTLKQIKNLQDYCDFDIDKRIATIHLNYDTPLDLIDPHLSHDDKPVVSDATTAYIQELIHDIPKEFKIEFMLSIYDYQNYSPESLINALNNTIESTYYYFDEERKKYNALAVIFILLGIVFLAINVVGGAWEWFGQKESTSAEVAESLLDILTWVFIWEGGAIIFLTYENASHIFNRDISRLQKVSFSDSHDKRLGTLDKERVERSLNYVKKGELLARNFILASTAIILAICTIDTLENIVNIQEMSFVSIISGLLQIISLIFVCVVILFYYRENNVAKKLTPIICGIYIIVVIVDIVFLFITDASYAPKLIFYDFMLLAVMIADLICMFYLRRFDVEV
ncbi:MAG: hypothetical protein MJ189_00225 [Coriobacteriales bacterium]|nr:hypothetical protein [Coriobacteriales bacterium]